MSPCTKSEELFEWLKNPNLSLVFFEMEVEVAVKIATPTGIAGYGVPGRSQWLKSSISIWRR